jgi:hypothetical protein
MKHPGTTDGPPQIVPGLLTIPYRLDGSLMSRELRVYWRLAP